MLKLRTTAEGALDIDDVEGDELDALETAALLSLLLDARAADDDDVPEGASRRGYWGDAFDSLIDGVDPPGPLGSRLWLLEGAAVTEPNARRAERYAAEALGWMISGKLARSVKPTCETSGDWLKVRVEVEARRTREKFTVERTLKAAVH